MLRHFLNLVRRRQPRGQSAQASQRPRPSHRPLQLETLERRLAPACSFLPSSALVTCNFANDAIELRLQGTQTEVFANGVRLGSTQARTVQVDGGAGSNSLLVNDSALTQGDTY